MAASAPNLRALHQLSERIMDKKPLSNTPYRPDTVKVVLEFSQ